MTEPTRYIRLDVEAAEDLGRHLAQIKTSTAAIEQLMMGNIYPTPKTVKR